VRVRVRVRARVRVRVRARARALRARCRIEPNPTRAARKRYDKARDRHRNAIERFFARVKQCRRVAARYERKPESFLGFVRLAAPLNGLG
jgi:transposase